MENDAEYLFEERRYRIVVLRKDRTWGHVIDATIYDDTNQIWAKAAFACHPEFSDFEKYQAMGTADLLDRAVEKLRNGAHIQIAETRKHGLQLCLRLNGDRWLGPFDQSRS